MDWAVFRPAFLSDSARIAALHAASWRSAYRGMLPDTYLDHEIDAERRRMWEARLSAPDADRRYVLLAETGGELVGFACVLLDVHPQWGACLDNLHVHPEFKGRHLGRRLFADAVRWVRVNEPGWPLHLWVFEGNRHARRFYEAFGGRAVSGERNAMPGGVCVASVRYVWENLHTLLAALSQGS